MSETITLKVEETMVHTFTFDVDEIPPTVDITTPYAVLEWANSCDKVSYLNGEPVGKGYVYLEGKE